MRSPSITIDWQRRRRGRAWRQRSSAEGTELYSTPERIRRYAARLLLAEKPELVSLDRSVVTDAPAWFDARLKGLASFDAAAIGVADFAYCVALANWPAVRTLVLATSGSGAEREAVAALTPVLGG